MKIAIVCPVGDLTRFGYWRIAQTCLESWRALGDLYLIHSSRVDTPLGIKANHIRYSKTLMQVVNGAEWFDHRLVAANANLGLEAARQSGCDIALTICVNWYVEQTAAEKMRNRCERLFEDDNPCGFLYRRIQIGAQLFDADRMSIAIFNLKHVADDAVKILVDCADIDGATVSAVRGHFPNANDEAYIDCEYELTIDELREKLADIRNYEDILPKRHGVDWDYWLRYYQERAADMLPSHDEPGPVGQRIMRAHPAGSFGDWLLTQRLEAA